MLFSITPEAHLALAAYGMRAEITPTGQTVVLSSVGEKLFVAEPPTPHWPNTYIQRWYRFATSREIVTIIRHIALPAYLAQGAPPRSLNDSYHSEGPWFDAIPEVSAEIIPLWVTHGLRYAAMVAPQDIFAQLSTEEFVAEISSLQKLTLRTFATEAEAWQWLMSLPLD